MNPSFAAYIESAKSLASARDLKWNVDCDDAGHVIARHRWNLTALVGMLPPPTTYLGQLGGDRAVIEALNAMRANDGLEPLTVRVMPREWCDLYQAVIIHQLVVDKNKPGTAMQLARGIRQLAPVAGWTMPWDVTPEQVRDAYNAVLQVGQSGKVAMNFEMTLRAVFDAQHLADTPALARFCLPFVSTVAGSAQRNVQARRRRESAHHRTDRLRGNLSERKSASKLPEQRAFWELVRIVFTQTPRSFSDAVRFGVLKTLLLTGFRIGEAVLLPADWQRWREYVDGDGRPAGEAGGVSRSLMIRHFAEKQVDDERPEGLSLYESAQHVPPMFQDLLTETLTDIDRITEPLRSRLKRQTETGRIFPEYPRDALVPAWEMYTRVTGNAMFSNVQIPPELVTRYRSSGETIALGEIRAFQLASGGPWRTVKQYWLNSSNRSLIIRDAEGAAVVGKIRWRQALLRVGEVEDHIRANSATKLSDVSPAALLDGSALHPHELLFLMPVRNLIEGRNDGLLDPTLYSAIGRISSSDIDNILDGRNGESIFRRYGSENPENLVLNSHALRHLQTTELFRLGVADTIITKRFNRRGVAQSYEYDHRSLAEDLDNVDAPLEPAEELGENARQIYRLIAANRASGPIVDEFKRVQAEHGDTVAFEYLSAEADGLHVTPYGLCVNSFTVDPCPKHLECFNGCIHLTRTDVRDELVHLERLRDRMARVVGQITEVPEARRTVGWRNQLAHARTRLDNIDKAIAARPGMKPFPDGEDLSKLAGAAAKDSVLGRLESLRELDD